MISYKTSDASLTDITEVKRSVTSHPHNKKPLRLQSLDRPAPLKYQAFTERYLKSLPAAWPVTVVAYWGTAREMRFVFYRAATDEGVYWVIPMVSETMDEIIASKNINTNMFELYCKEQLIKHGG